MLKTVRAYIARQEMLPPGTRVLVGVSGGADSVALLHLLHRLSLPDVSLAAAYLDHGLRGKAGSADRAFVEQAARALNIPFIAGRSHVRQLAKRKGLSAEMAGREARHRFFKSSARKMNCDTVALAHHADDQSETLLLRLARGTGLDGLSGILPVIELDGLRIVRPLLCVTGRQILAYLKRNHLEWREDETNRDTEILRNRTRHILLPQLEAMFDAPVGEGLARTAELLQDDAAWLDLAEKEGLEACAVSQGLDLEALRNWPACSWRRILRAWLVSKGWKREAVTSAHLNQLLELIHREAGVGRADLPGGRSVVRRYDQLEVETTGAVSEPYRVRLQKDRWVSVPGTNLEARYIRKRGPVARPRTRLGHFPVSAAVSEKQVGRAGLYIRSWQQGDRMQPLGMKGTRKVHDLFVDRKLPRAERAGYPVLECRKKVAWLPGYTIGAGFAVQKGQESHFIVEIRPKTAG